MSVAVLNALMRSLNSEQEKLTNKEVEIFKQWNGQTVKHILVEGSASLGLTWMATRKLNVFNRVTLAGGACTLTALWRITRSADSLVDRILGMDGSRMYHELNKIILERYGNDPEKMQLYFSKHFYGEEVFDDSTPEHPKLVYRPRNMYMDDQRMSYGSTSQESAKNGEYYHQRNDGSNVKLKNPGSQSKQVSINPGLKVFGCGDPLDVLFGDSSASEEPHQPYETEKSAKAQSHSQRKARRRHRARHRHQEMLPMGMTQSQVA